MSSHKRHQHHPNPSHSTQIPTPACLAAGVLQVEQAYADMEQLLTDHVEGTRIATREIAEAAVVGFLQLHETLVQEAVRYADELATIGQSLTDPRVDPGNDLRRARVLEEGVAAQRTLAYLQELSTRGQQLAARMGDMKG